MKRKEKKPYIKHQQGDFIMYWDHAFMLYGLNNTFDNIDVELLEEHFNETNKDIIKQFYNIKIQNEYDRWGRGLDENGEFCPSILYFSRKGIQGSFPITSIKITQKQWASNCEFGILDKNEYSSHYFICQQLHREPNSYHECRCCKHFKEKR